MSSVALLDKTRKIGSLLHNNTSSKVVFNDICQVMTDIVESNALVISKKGKVLGICNKALSPISELLVGKVGYHIDEALNGRFLTILSTKENCSLMTLGFEIKDRNKYNAIVCPINVAGVRYGTLFLYRKNKEYDLDDIILSEYCSTVVGLEIMRAKKDEIEEDERKNEVVKGALEVLTNTELRAAKCILDEINGEEGLIVTSRIADQVGITRSVCVNALKKLESAGLIATQSAGMKGTHIRVVNKILTYSLLK